jgi:hypothetical protein
VFVALGDLFLFQEMFDLAHQILGKPVASLFEGFAQIVLIG